jgi:short-subunit dehydrogenase
VTSLAVIVITGASSGIGEATARHLGQLGHKLVLAARRVERLEQVRAELRGKAEVLVTRTDVAHPGAMETLAEQTVARFGAIDIWINNAGIGHEPIWWEGTPESIERVVAVNLTAPMLGAHTALRHMLPRGRGHIINVGSVAGHIGSSGIYSGTKFGLRGHTEALRREVRALGISVSLVSPGFIRTEMTQKVPMRMPSADVIARAIARLITRPRSEVVVPGWYRLLIGASILFPWLVEWAISRWMKDRQRRNPGL